MTPSGEGYRLVLERSSSLVKGNYMASTDAPATTEAAKKENELPPLKFVDEVQELTHKQLTNFITERNALVGKANAASGDRQTLTEQIRENDQDPEIVKAREEWAAAYERLMNLVTPKVESVIADSQGSVSEIEEKIKEIDGKLKVGLTYYKKVYDVDGNEPSKHLPSQDRLKGSTLRSGAGGRRIRGYHVEVTMDGDTERFENFASAAKHLDVETSDLQKAFFEKAGTTDLKKVPDEVNMTLNYVEVDEEENETEKEAFVRAFRLETEEAANANESDSAEDSE